MNIQKESHIHGLMAEFDTPTAIVAAAHKAYAAGYRKMDAYSPFPIEELSEAIGFHTNRVPLIVLAGGLIGFLSGLGLQIWASAIEYPLNVGGRPTALSQTSTNSIKLHRLDVDNVEVTKEDGSTYLVTGKYEVFFGGTRVAGPYNTNGGIDLLPGTYELVVTFNTADGPQTQRETFTL